MSKVALMISGLPRLWQPCLPTQLELFKENQADVFFHFWDVIPDDEKKALVDLLNPKAYFFEKPQDYSRYDERGGVAHPDNINIPSRMMSQYHSWRQVARLVEPFLHDYAFGVRTRSDLQFVYGIEHIFAQLKPNDMLMQKWGKEQELVGDIFCLGGIDGMMYFHRLLDHVDAYAKHQVFNSEVLLNHHMEQRPDLHIYTESFPFYFVRRPHMDGYTIEQCLKESPGQNKWLDTEQVQAHKDFYIKRLGAIGELHVDTFRHNQIQKMKENLGQDKGS